MSTVLPSWLASLQRDLAKEVANEPIVPFLVNIPFTRKDVDSFLKNIFVEDSRTLVLIGKSGAGKTNLLNHLCRAPIFVSEQSAKSITKSVQKAVVRSKIYERREVKFEIFDTPGLFDTNLDNETISKTMKKFFLYDCSQVNLVFIMIKEERVTGEFQKLLQDALAMFQKTAVKILRIVVTHSNPATRNRYMKSFFSTHFVVDLIKEWNFTFENFVFVDLNLAPHNYCVQEIPDDVAKMCEALMASTVPLHKTEVFSQFLSSEFQQQYSVVSNPISISNFFWSSKK